MLPIDHSALANNTTAHPVWRRERRIATMITANTNSTSPTAQFPFTRAAAPTITHTTKAEPYNIRSWLLLLGFIVPSYPAWEVS